MLMIGTASHNTALPEQAAGDPVTSDLTCEEMWNLTNMGYMPLKLVLGHRRLFAGHPRRTKGDAQVVHRAAKSAISRR